MKKHELNRALEADRKEIEGALEETLSQTIREAWLPNTVVWVGVVGGGFLLNLLVLLLVSVG
ncbi:MAG TPA: hypothetical protein VHR55_04790 [Candidatus Limnocylindria bacterium]|nr:hypothetical protein [Candidatus Limnocylindria bacterium]